jgi:6-phosphogluconolactonase/glucosamine-6-phosphate isomerase/deaminase
VTQSGLASTFVTKLDMPDQGQAGKRENKDKNEKGKSEDSKPKRDMSEVKCFTCGEKGHIAPNFPDKEKEQETSAKEDEGKAKTFVSWEDDWEDQDEVGTYVTYQVCNEISRHHEFGDYDILLDNQADVSILHPRLL